MGKLIHLIVKKVGRKWLEVKEENEYVNGKLLIDYNTKDFEVGSEINILGDKEKVKNRYGTTITYTCEKIVEGEELVKLKEENNKNSIINAVLNNISNYATKIEQIKYPVNTQSTIYKDFINTLNDGLEKSKKYNIEGFVDAANVTLLALYNNTNSAKLLDELLTYSFVNNDNKILFKDKAILLREQYKINTMNELSNKLQKYHYNINTNSTIYKEFMETVNGNLDFQKIDIKLFLEATNNTIGELVQYTKSNAVLQELLSLSVINKENKEIIENILLEDYNKDMFVRLNRKHQVNALNIYTEIPEYSNKFNVENTELYYSLMGNSNNFSKEDTLETIKNIYIKKDFEEFKKYIKYNYNNSILDNYFDEEVKIQEFFDKYSYKGYLYILNIRINNVETFKQIMNSKVVIKVNVLAENANYVVINPWDLFDMLVIKNEITVAKELTDIEKIRLFGRSIGNNFSFIKDNVYGQTYYFVTEEISSKYNYSSYNAYYLIGTDDEHGTGFQHRLPWEESKYTNMTVKDVVDYTFGFKQGFNRVQGDVIAREVTIQEDNIKKIEITTNCEIKLENHDSFTFVVEKITNKYINNELVQDNSILNNRKMFTSIDTELRKDMQVIAEKSLQYNNSDMILFNGRITYKGEVILDFTDKCIYLRNNKDESFKKLKFNFYYLNAELGKTSTKEEIILDSILTKAIVPNKDGTSETLNRFNSPYTAFRVKEHKATITAKAGEHILTSSGYNGEYNLFEGPITIKHSSHNTVVFGEEGKYYQVALAVRHKTEK